MRGRRLAATALAALTFAGSWAIGMAVAEPGPPSLVLRDVGAQVATAIEIDKMYPGLAVTRPYVVGLNDAAPAALLTMTVDNLVDLEQGCNRPETAAGDATCDDGADAGELSQQLLVSAVLTSAPTAEACDAEPTSVDAVLAPTPLEELVAARALDLAETAGSGERRCLLLTFDLPWSADNLVQTDVARFDLRIGAEQAVDSDVAGDATTRPDRPAGVPSTGVLSGGTSLPATGVDLALWGLGAVATMLLGAVALRLTRRPSRSR